MQQGLEAALRAETAAYVLDDNREALPCVPRRMRVDHGLSPTSVVGRAHDQNPAAGTRLLAIDISAESDAITHWNTNPKIELNRHPP